MQISNKVFKHLVGKTKGTNYTDALARLRHIPNAKQILEIIDDILDVVKKSSRITIYALLGQIEDGRFLKVIVEFDAMTGMYKLISLYEITSSFYAILVHSIGQSEEVLFREQFKKPVVKLELKNGQKISGWLLLSGKLSDSHHKIILYTVRGLVLMDLPQTKMERLKLGTRITVHAIEQKKLVKEDLSDGFNNKKGDMDTQGI